MPRTMSEPRELMLHELQDMLYAEKAVAKMLPKMANESTDPELAEGFQHHLEETKQQIANLEEVFEALGKPARAKKCEGIEGLKAEHDSFVEKESPSPELCDMFLTGAGSRTEHYEIAGYTGLLTMARALGEERCVPLLEENLRMEQETLQKLERISKRLVGVGNGASA